MRRRDRASRIRERMRIAYNLDQGDDKWEVYYQGTPLVILGCQTMHYNGINKDGIPLLTQGRFGINKNIHQKLEGERGLYLFVVYRALNGLLLYVDDRIVPVRYMSPLIGKGKVTKIGWAKIFHLPSGKR